MSIENGEESGTDSLEKAESGRRKLLVLDVNGLLIHRYRRGEQRPARPHDGAVSEFLVYNRPFCDDFLRFCFDHFVVGVWSSAQMKNVHNVVDYIFKEAKGKLAFVWHQGHCTNTGFRHPDNHYKPVFLKELWKLWRKIEPGLPWEAGDYGPSNTLLIDDSAYKAIKNPPHTAIFPKTWSATDIGDNFLGKSLRTFLEGLLRASDVQTYIQENLIGEPAITVGGDPRWSKIYLSLRAQMEPSTLVAPIVVEPEQLALPDVPSSPLVDEGGGRRASSRHDEKELDVVVEQENREQDLSEEDVSDLHNMIRKLQLREVPA